MLVNIEVPSECLINDLKRFYHSYYDDDNRIFSHNYLMWLLHNNPHGVGKSVNVRLDDNIIGNMFMIPIRLNRGNNGYYIVDVLTHPEHRDKNLFVKMIRTMVDKVKSDGGFIIGHPNSNAMPGWKRTKMTFYPKFTSYISKIGFYGKRKRVKTISDITKDDEFRINKILRDSKRVVVDANVEFILWKYLNNQYKKYKVEFIYFDNVLRGVIVSYKVKKIIDRVVHFLMEDGFDKYIFNSSILPRVFSFSNINNGYYRNDFFYRKSIGSEVNYFFTDYGHHGYDVSFITYAACDN